MQEILKILKKIQRFCGTHICCECPFRWENEIVDCNIQIFADLLKDDPSRWDMEIIEEVLKRGEVDPNC